MTWKKRLVFAAKCVVVLFLLWLVFFLIRTQPTPGCGYSQEYLAGTGNIRGNVDVEYFESLGPEFAIGANREGYAVFKNPRAVMWVIYRDYRPGLMVLMENGLYFPVFGIAVGGCTSGLAMDLESTNTEGLEQAHEICNMMDIYENCFQWGQFIASW